MLISAEYVWQEYEQADLDDWAAPAIQYCRALELELKRRLSVSDPLAYIPRRWGLGMPEHAMRWKDRDAETRNGKNARHNWHLMRERARQAGASIEAFEAVLQRLVSEQVLPKRNGLAHGAAVPGSAADALRTTIVGSRNREGLLCWIAEHLEPLPLTSNTPSDTAPL
jgi:hypothetical protein